MSDRFQAGKPPQYFTQPPRPTHPPTLSGTGNEYRQSAAMLYGCGAKAASLFPSVDIHVRAGGR